MECYNSDGACTPDATVELAHCRIEGPKLRVCGALSPLRLFPIVTGTNRKTG
jgi:hypothetical protein